VGGEGLVVRRVVRLRLGEHVLRETLGHRTGAAEVALRVFPRVHPLEVALEVVPVVIGHAVRRRAGGTAHVEHARGC